MTRPLAVLMFATGTVAAAPFSANELNEVRPQGQVEDHASITGRMSWCDGAGPLPTDVWSGGRISRAIGSREAFDMWADAAVQLCRESSDPTWQKQAGYLVQSWMNARNLSQADAEKEIASKIAKLKVERANEGREPTPEERFAFSPNFLDPIEPANGMEAAKLGDKAAWCDKAQIGTDKWDAGRIHRTFTDKYGIDGKIKAALHICQRNDPTWKTEAGYILQNWMNWTRMPQADAEASLRSRIQIEKFAAEKAALCKALEPGEEAGGSVKAFAKAQQRFFACTEDAMWINNRGTDESIGFWLERAQGPEAELMRLYWLLDYVEAPDDDLPSKDQLKNRALVLYAIAQRDFAAIDKGAIDKLLAGEPYNDYARTIAAESLSMLKWRQRTFERVIDKMTKGDEDYTAIFRDAPKKAAADWQKIATTWKAELARSDAFEQKLALPSRKALKGCNADLQKDAEKLIRSLKADDYNTLVETVGTHPVAGLLLSRLAICDAVEGIYGGSGALADLIKHGRELRGPRSVTYYAVVEAIATAAKDRPRLLVSNNLWPRATSLLRMYDGLPFTGGAPRDPEKSYDKGVIASVKKVPDGLLVTFAKQKISFPETSCKDDTHHPLKIGSDGRIEYYRNCKNTGKMLSQDETPAPMIIAPELAAGVKAGAYVVAATGRNKAGHSVGIVVYTKKNATAPKIQTFFGFTL